MKLIIVFPLSVIALSASTVSAGKYDCAKDECTPGSDDCGRYSRCLSNKCCVPKKWNYKYCGWTSTCTSDEDCEKYEICNTSGCCTNYSCGHSNTCTSHVDCGKHKECRKSCCWYIPGYESFVRDVLSGKTKP